MVNPTPASGLTLITINFVSMALQYFALAGLIWWLAYRRWDRRLAPRKIIAAQPTPRQVRREILLSLLTAALFGFTTLLVAWFARNGLNQIYWEVSEHGVLWLAASTGFTIVLWDTWFYWTHRAMHHPRLFRRFHRSHHLSHNPTPWTAYALDPLEAAVYAVFVPLVTFMYPLHPMALALFMGFQLLFNVASHSGFEIMPAWFGRSRLARFICTPTSHVIHHESGRGNYGFCFQIWDRLMGTCHPQYDRRFRDMTDPSSAADGPRLKTAQK